MTRTADDTSAPTEAIRDRWVTTDRWAEYCGESRVRQGQDHEVLEGLRQARADIGALLVELDGLRGRIEKFAGFAEEASVNAASLPGTAAGEVARAFRTIHAGLRHTLAEGA